MNTRREFLQMLPAGGATLLLTQTASAQQYPHLGEAETRALEVGYVEDAARVDRQKYPKYRPGQLCTTCELYQAKPTQPWAPCTLFPRRVVAGKGWCDAFRTRSLLSVKVSEEYHKEVECNGRLAKLVLVR